MIFATLFTLVSSLSLASFRILLVQCIHPMRIYNSHCAELISVNALFII